MRWRILRTARFHATALFAFGLVGLYAWGSPAGAGAPADSDKTEPPKETAEDAGEPAAEGVGTGESEWHTDENGLVYRIIEVPKGREGAHYQWVDEKRVRIALGMVYEVLEETDTTFKLKSYSRSKSKARAPSPSPPAEPSPELAEKVAESYRSDLEEVDWLRFEAFDEGLPRRGQWRNGFDVADMNGDGELDIVFGPSRKGHRRPTVFLGDGKGAWKVWKEARFPRAPYDYGDAAVADFNGDGHMDLALAIHLSGHLVLVGNGRGSFEKWTEGISLETPGRGGDASTFSSRAIEAVDWNRDGRPDILALGEGPKGLPRRADDQAELVTANGPILFVNNGDGSWSPKGYTSDVFGDSLATGDFDGDGRLDFATANHVVGSSTILHIGRGGGWEPVAVNVVRPGGIVRSVAAGRLNRDDADDLVIGYQSKELGVARSGVDVIYGSGDGDWQRRPLFAVEGRRGIYSVAVGDLNGDGRLDIVSVTGHGEIHVFLAEESGGYVRESAPEFPGVAPGCRGFETRLIDLDGDGRDELITAFAGEVTGLPRFGGNPGCVDGGSLRAWTAVAKEPAETPVAGP